MKKKTIKFLRLLKLTARSLETTAGTLRHNTRLACQRCSHSAIAWSQDPAYCDITAGILRYNTRLACQTGPYSAIAWSPDSASSTPCRNSALQHAACMSEIYIAIARSPEPSFQVRITAQGHLPRIFSWARSLVTPTYVHNHIRTFPLQELRSYNTRLARQSHQLSQRDRLELRARLA